MAKRGGNHKKKKKPAPKSSGNNSQVTPPANQPVLPPPSRRDRPVKKIRRQDVSDSDESERGEEDTSDTNLPEITIISTQSRKAKIRVMEQDADSEAPVSEEEAAELNPPPSRRKTSQIKRVRKEEVSTPDLEDDSETDLSEAIGTHETALDEDFDEALEDVSDAEEDIEDSVPEIVLDEHGFRIDLPEMDEDGDWEDGVAPIHTVIEPGKQFWMVAEAAVTDDDGDTEEVFIPEVEDTWEDEPEPVLPDLPEEIIPKKPEVIVKADPEPIIEEKPTEKSAESRPTIKSRQKTVTPEPESAPPSRRKEKQTPSTEHQPMQIEVEAPRKPPRQRRKRRWWPWLLVILLLGGGATAAAWFIYPEWFFAKVEEPTTNCLGIEMKLRPGLSMNRMECTNGVMMEGETLQSLLLAQKVDWKQPIQLLQQLSFKSIQPPAPGTKYTLLFEPKDPLHPVILSYEPNAKEVVLLILRGEADVYRYQRPLISETYHSEGAILTKPFAETMYNRQSGLDLTQMVYDAMKWKMDLFELKSGDRFKMVYKESVVEGGNATIDGLEAIQFTTEAGDFTAFHFKDDLVEGFFDEEGRPVKSTFLMMPLRYGRLSSPYSLNRPDPLSIDGKIIPHLGTDYAAPEGTEILAVSDGIVEEAGFSGGNGNYVKLSHQAGIQTQYLHMRNIGDGIQPGQYVQQGDVIGYVGMTGRATGPHVCFRYWKNGIQVDHRREKYPTARPLTGERVEQFYMKRDSMIEIWDKLALTTGL